jgi:hypothetical protein
MGQVHQLVFDEDDAAGWITSQLYGAEGVGRYRGLKAPVSITVATTAALPAYTQAGQVLTAVANGNLVVDGYGVSALDRVLVKNENAENVLKQGLYEVTQGGDGGSPYILTLADDAATTDAINRGLLLLVQNGTVNGGKGFMSDWRYKRVYGTNVLTFTRCSVPLALASGHSRGFRLISGTYALDAETDGTVVCTSGSFTVTLPDAAGIQGYEFTIANEGTGLISIATTGGQTIDGDASLVIVLSQYESLTVVSTGSNWKAT